mmetsp:Transcript_8921/g.7886  ORF Transcript_8921/g.7886 Transcript_8921/m.7886 type:complete len:109 (+) Transcript_8921:496-822(+)|eukprot:CAMPEP_0114575878 /NCGR_PEP_ID=MMETSP0125-20121206/700_1 /TAXON_ID=485358 ORGANISM="Aristerostoma sp., Strain ATCC 50986" /NCGR_SAMPLE_ID=MMETSP0125 /ASSEMBLY_ACC=CAM_ASM_000245 /LENGTH=108 /DNA_ID=CAMNT_0001763953 /DNA_START=1753 /DNA_END=2079 /DNA_ORIENTATION=-
MYIFAAEKSVNLNTKELETIWKRDPGTYEGSFEDLLNLASQNNWRAGVRYSFGHKVPENSKAAEKYQIKDYTPKKTIKPDANSHKKHSPPVNQKQYDLEDEPMGEEDS